MQEHPVPQQISSYSFKLVGDMTLKQFFEVAGGVGVGILFYITGLPGIIKWPLILTSVLIGGALAFIPFEERPLEQWIFAFFRSVYSPTLFYWKKIDVKPQYFQSELPIVSQKTPAEKIQEIEAVKPEILREAQKREIQEAGKEAATFLSNLESTERTFLSQINNLFSLNLIPPQPKNPPTEPPKPEPLTVPVAPVITVPKVKVEEPKINPIIAPAQNVQVSKVEETLKATAPLVSQQAQFATNAPSMPTQPNTITGQIMDTKGKIVEGAIIEIRDSVDRPARALKTNKAGHFLISIPFSNGKYEIIVEKEGLGFTPVSFEANGNIIPPIIIKADKIVETKDIFQYENI